VLARFARRVRLSLVGSAALVVVLASPAAAPPGDLDPTFGGDGKVTTDFPGSFSEVGRAVAIQADGKIVALGTAAVSGMNDFALARYNIDGSLDTAFSGDGMVTTDFAGDTDEAYGLAIQPDGKIVTAGLAVVSGNFDFALARYNPDGSLDTTFDGDGKVTTDFLDALEAAFGVAIQGDGTIVAAGCVGCFPGTAFALARYNVDGSLDTTFDLDGKVTTPFTGSNDTAAWGVAIQADGKIVAEGYAAISGYQFALARYNTDGSLDSTFDGDGKVTTDIAGGNDRGFGVTIQGDGRIVAVGEAAIVSGPPDFALARYNGDGSLDSSFDGDGKVTTDFAGDYDRVESVAIQNNGKIVTAGFARVSGTNDFALARYNADGALDTTFGGDGKVTTDFAGSTDEAYGVAIQSNGRIVAAGGAFVSGFNFALARYTCIRRTSRPMSIPVCP
jgi:uncharacterized delta-60 repeat protein